VKRSASSPPSLVARIVRALVVVVWALLPLLGSTSVARAQGLKIKVRGSAKLVAHASRDHVGAAADGTVDLVLSGALSDDAGQPLAGETVTVHVRRESDPRDAQAIEGLRGARSCDRGTDRPPTAYAVRVAGPADAPEVVTVTDDGGRFCFRARLAADRHIAHLAWRGSALVDASDVDVAFDLSRQTLLLRYDPTPMVVTLDSPRTSFEVAALVEEEGATHAQPRLELALTNEQNVELGRAVTDSSGRARFIAETAKLGPPGRGELRVSFRGDRDTAFATTVAEIERRVKVSVRVPAAERGELTAQVPEEGIALLVDVTSAAGPVSEGGVEARIGETVIGAAPVERGVARLTLTFTSPGNEALVRLRYAPSAPWFEPLGDSTVRVPIRGPSLLSKAPILLAGVAVLVFFLVGRVASKNSKPEPAPAKAAEAEARVGKPRLDVVRHAARGESGWRGQVVDAHEGTPVPDARLWIERGTFDGQRILARAQGDRHGRFELPPFEGVVGDEQIACEAPLHARLVQPLPPPGELSIAVVLRRRAVLARLVSWARRRGAPFDVKPEPTPGHVRRAAANDPATARWAEAVERAVFGAGHVDARVEGEIDRLAPTPGAPPRASEADDAPTDEDDRR